MTANQTTTMFPGLVRDPVRREGHFHLPIASTHPAAATVMDAGGGAGGGIRQLEQVSDVQLALYARLIHERTGIHVSSQKKLLLSNRLRRRLTETGIRNFDSYYRYLSKLPDRDDEWNKFFQAITTHETYLFRDEGQWEWLSRVFLREHAAASRNAGKPRGLRVWSAACSTGDEVYTIACCIAANLPNPAAWRIDILGTDIAMGELDRAREGVFGERAMRLVPSDYLRFFEKDDHAEKWTARPVLRRMARFACHNLMHRLPERAFDVVFLKNVLIYFDKNSKKTAIDNVAPLVRPGGFLIAGAAEGVTGLADGFRRVSPWLYQRAST